MKALEQYFMEELGYSLLRPRVVDGKEVYHVSQGVRSFVHSYYLPHYDQQQMDAIFTPQYDASGTLTGLVMSLPSYLCLCCILDLPLFPSRLPFVSGSQSLLVPPHTPL
eukprot:GHVU01038359.1.p1 GENE.GHVU01038359.1~~GHVU01038359.1.p1  ORF type:complete len:109 (-),score=7.16 GHVU01038359.1:426-752(-)